MLEPLRGTEAHVRQLLTESPTAADLLRNNLARRVRHVTRMTGPSDWQNLFNDYGNSSFMELLRREAPHLMPGAPPPAQEAPPEPPMAPPCTPCVTGRGHHGGRSAGDRRLPVAGAGSRRSSRPTSSPASASPASPVPPPRWRSSSRRSSSTTRRWRADKPVARGQGQRLSQMIRMNLPAAMQGLVVVPIFAGFDEKAGIGRLFKYDVTGGRYEETNYDAQGSDRRTPATR